MIGSMFTCFLDVTDQVSCYVPRVECIRPFFCNDLQSIRQFLKSQRVSFLQQVPVSVNK